jgi:PPOX class probable F420-dependent enzyme
MRRMAKLNAAARRLIESGALAHLVTLNEDGSPQVAIVWVGVDGDQLVAGHLDPRQRKLANMRRDPRVALSFETGVTNAHGLREYLVVHGTAEITEGGAADLLRGLAKNYLGPDSDFLSGVDAPPGFICHITVNRIAGVGDWRE